MRVVRDTDVFLSGIHWTGASHQVLRAWFIGKFVMVSSPEINEELFAQFRDFKIQMDSEEISWWETILLEKSIAVEPKIKFSVVKEDPDDNKFLEAAFEGGCDCIVSQDNHLLKLKEFKGVKIMTPKEFIKLVE